MDTQALELPPRYEIGRVMQPAQVRYGDGHGDIMAVIERDDLTPTQLHRWAVASYPANATCYETYVWAAVARRWERTTFHDRARENAALRERSKFAALDHGRDRL